MREKIIQGLGALVGALLSWPTVSRYLGTLPDYHTVEWFGAGVGFILGLFLQTTKVVQKTMAPWHSGWKFILLLLVVAAWLYLNYDLCQQYQRYGAASGDMTPERFAKAQFAVGTLSVIWAAPLAYIGAAIAEALDRKFRS